MSHLTKQFRKLHTGPDTPLRLANAWDAGSARIVESLGAKAVATTSAGMAWALGYPDGNIMPVSLVARVVENIMRIITIPVSIDVEAGYSDDPKQVGENLKRVFSSGIAGINIEDGTDSVDLLAAKIAEVKNVLNGLGIDVFVNVRTDVYLQALAPEGVRKEETIRRAAIYRNAGADGIFVPALANAPEIKEIASAVGIPLNVLAWPGLPPADELGKLGVGRLSAGSGIPQVIWNHVARLAKNFLDRGASEPLSEDYMAHGALQALFSAPSE